MAIISISPGDFSVWSGLKVTAESLDKMFKGEQDSK